MKELIVDNNIFVKKGMTITQLRDKLIDENIEDNIFFWLDGVHKLYSLEASFQIGMYYKNGVIKNVEIFLLDDYKSNLSQSDDNKRYKELINEMLKDGFNNTDFQYSFDRRNGYGSIILKY